MMWPFLTPEQWEAWAQGNPDLAAGVPGVGQAADLDPERARIVECPTCKVRWHFPTIRKCWVDGRHSRKWRNMSAMATGGAYSWSWESMHIHQGSGVPDEPYAWMMPAGIDWPSEVLGYRNRSRRYLSAPVTRNIHHGCRQIG